MGSLRDKVDLEKEDVGLGNVPNVDATDWTNWNPSGAQQGQSPVWDGTQWVPGAISLANPPLTNAFQQTITAQDTVNINLNNGHNISIILDDTNINTLTISNASQACLINLLITKTGSGTISWPSSIVWNKKNVPTLTSINLIRLFTVNSGSEWKGFVSVAASN